MTSKQITALFTYDLIPFMVANALLALMPVYLAERGVDPSMSGVFLAAVFTALVGGTLSGGWLLRRFGDHRRIMALASIVNVPIAVAIGLADSVLLLALLAMASWFVGGVMVAGANILVGAHSRVGHRGRAFGLIGASGVLGQMLGGAIAGPIVDTWGFPALCIVGGALYALPVLLAPWLPADWTPTTADQRTTAPLSQWNVAIILLMAGSLLVFVANFVTALARPLVMHERAFDATAIASTIAISGLINLPLPLLIGWLSDRIGHRSVLAVCYVGVAAGVGLLAVSTTIWHFWLSQILITLSRSAISVGSALVTDLVAPEDLNAALSRFVSTRWIGAVIGYGITGFALQALGGELTLALGATLPLVAIALTNASQPARQVVSVQPSLRTTQTVAAS